MPRGGAARTPQLYLTQSAILEVDAHLRESTSPVPFGLLVGALCICPQENLVYLLIDTVTRSRTELSESDPYAQLASELRSLIAQQEKQGKLTIGWYLGGMADDLTLDSDVRGLHRQLLPEPRHLLLLRGEADGIDHGAFLRFDGSSDSAYPIPFFELLPERELRKTGARRSVVRWKEYRSNESAIPLGESDESERRGDLTSSSRWGSRGLNGSVESLRQGSRPPSRDKPAAAPVLRSASPQERAAEHIRLERPVEHHDPPSAPAREAAHPAAEILVPRTPVASADTISAPATEQSPAATPPPSGPEPLAHTRSPIQEPTPPRVEHVRQSPRTLIETNGARRTPASDLQHIFIDGTLVPVRWTHRRDRNSRLLATIRGLRIAPLLMVALVLLVMAVLYRFAL
jgi:hypothetical protein